MIDMSEEANGNLIAVNAGGSLVRIDAQTHVQSLVATGGLLSDLDGGTVDVNHGGTIFVNACQLDERYRLTHEPVVVTLDL